MRSAINTFLILLFVLTVCLSSAVYAYDCPVGIESGHQTWNGSIYGSAPYLCLGTAGNCKYKATVNLCFAESGECVGDFVSTGDVCTESEGEQGNMMWPGGDFIDVPEPEEPEKMQTVCYNNYYSNETGALKVTCEYDMKMPALTSKVSQTNGIIERLYSSTNTHFSALSASLDQHDYFTKVFADSTNEHFAEQKALIKENTDGLVDGISSLEALLENQDALSESQTSLIRSEISMSAGSINSQIGISAGNLANQIGNMHGSIMQTLYSDTTPTAKLVKDNAASIAGLSTQLSAIQDAINNMEGGSGDNTEVMSAISSLSGDVSGLSDDIGTLSGTVDGLSTALGDGFEGLNTELQGIGDGIDSIVGTLNGDGLSTRGSEGKIDFNGTGLYGEETLTEMKAEIETLKTEYSEQMKAMQGLFSFDSSELNGGQYVEHRWKFHLRGHEYSFGSSVFPALLDNSGLIAAVLLFLAVLYGVRFLVK
ncbi:hypothetical protein C1N32_16550 [Vibrio diazotrophicus]|uniref:Methyl-accepting chemotaxis protein n=1 Tax=Vibrio diazotrophicus TaxID=685 RepID=A0A2J8HYW2_VIBDI|nr:methyl-accepting chemotaxis protein [Vibrio diazotrophicus]PNI03462.1 hypothetical protein C1N32_16550 [Vibrio diazotrophicus]